MLGSFCPRGFFLWLWPRVFILLCVLLCLSSMGDYPCPRTSVLDPRGKDFAVYVRHLLLYTVAVEFFFLFFFSFKSHHRWRHCHCNYKRAPVRCMFGLLPNLRLRSFGHDSQMCWEVMRSFLLSRATYTCCASKLKSKSNVFFPLSLQKVYLQNLLSWSTSLRHFNTA